MWVAEGVAEIRWRVEWEPLLLLGPSPTYSITVQQPVLSRPGEHLRLRPFTKQVRQDDKKKKKKAQMKEQIKAPEKIQLSDEEIAHLSDAEFKILVIRMLTEMAE